MELLNPIEEILAEMFELGSHAISNVPKTKSFGFLKTIVADLSSRTTADDVMSKCLERWLGLDTFLNSFFMRGLSHPIFHTGRDHVHQAPCRVKLKDFFLTQLYAEANKGK